MKRVFLMTTILLMSFPAFAQNREDIIRQIDSLQAILKTLDGDIAADNGNEADDISGWQINTFKDKFGRETGNKFVSMIITDGKFSNTATSNSKLSVIVAIPGNGVQFILFEYGNHKLKSTIERSYVIYTLCGDKESHFYGSLKGDRVVVEKSIISKTGPDEFVDLLTNNDVSVVIEGEGSSYKFTIPSRGFTAKYQEAFYVH